MSGRESFLEVELKLLVAARDLASLQRHTLLRRATTGRVETVPLRSVYFDTAGFDLFRAGVSLRIRDGQSRDGEGNRLQTLKTSGKKRAGLFERAEVEVLTERSTPDLGVFPAQTRNLLQEVVGDQQLLPQVTTFVRRTRRHLRQGGAEMLCDLDVGEISVAASAGEQRFPLIELELELEKGEPSSLYELALALQTEIDLRVSTQSKSARGFELASGLRPGPQKARALSYSSGANFERVIGAVTGTAVDQILANQQPACDADDPEGVHQMRVGVRRLRSTLSLFKDLLPSDHLQRFRAELRWLGGELAEARDLDVFVDRTLRPCLEISERRVDADLKRLLEVALEEREAAYRRVRAAIDSNRYARLMLQLGAWIATRGWRQQNVSESSARLFSAARPRARKMLEKRHRSVRRSARKVSGLTAEERHALRIEVKKLRYASESLRPLFKGGQGGGRRKYLRNLESVQQALGAQNDDSQVPRVLDRLLERLGPGVEGGHRRAAGFVAGWSARRAEAEVEFLEGGLQKLRSSAPFWR